MNNVALALLIVGSLDTALGGLFWWLHRRAATSLRAWPDPGPWGEEKATWDRARDVVENLRVVRVVCINTGASMVCTALMLLGGWV